MAEQTQDSQSGSVFSSLRKALQQELDQLTSARQEITLTDGIFVESFADQFCYRFEIPEDLFAHPVESATFSVGDSQPMIIKGSIINVNNQFLTAALPKDFGPHLPETRCTWKYEDHVRPLLDKIPTDQSASFMASILFNPADELNSQAAPFEPQSTPQTPQNQQEALTKILQNRVSVVWGPVLTGKTHVLSLLAANYVKAGKRVLYVSNSHDNVDAALLMTVEIGQQIGADVSKSAVRLGFPSPSYFSRIGQNSFEQQIASLKNEKRKIFQERVQLLERYWSVRVKQCLNEDFYAKIQTMRDRLTELKKQSDQAARELDVLRDTIQSQQSSSMLEKLKKGFSKDDLAAAQKQFNEKQQAHKRLLSLQQSLGNEITLTESNAPIPADDMREYRLAMKRIEELGGLDRVVSAVDEFVAIDETAQLKAKNFVCAGVWSAVTDSRLKGLQFDLVAVDDAEAVPLPALAVLATLAKDTLVIAGDPFQLGPQSYSKSALVEAWLRKDIFLSVARTEQLHKLFDWTALNSRWAILLGSQFATTPKLPVFTSSVLFDDKINVFVPPNARGKIYFLDTANLKSTSKQYVGRRKILPYNDLHTRQVVDCVKHALLESQCGIPDIGVILPFSGPTLYTKEQLRMLGMGRIEVGTPESFHGVFKRAIIFDTTMAGVDYTIRQIDDRKAGEDSIARLFNTIFSCVREDLYIIADMTHFRTVYKDRLFTRLLMLLQAEGEQKPSFAATNKKYDGLEWDQLDKLLAESSKGTERAVPSSQSKPAQSREDVELALKMKMLVQQQAGKGMPGSRNIDRETHDAVVRILGVRKDLNLVSQYIGSDILLRSSLVSEQAMERLPHDFCQTERAFREIMERWNLIIYEMSGGHKTDLSYFSKKSPEARVRHDIRNLRVFYGSDVEAAIEEVKQKIAVEVSKVFQELLGKAQPSNPTEWSTAYLNFLAKLETYLFWISEQIRR